MIGLLTLLSALSLAAWVYLALFHGRFWLPLLPDASPEPRDWPSVDIVVPARNEADMLPSSLPSLLAQNYPGSWRVVLVDDHSSDGTAALALEIAARNDATEKISVMAAPEKPAGWSGKVAAMQAGVGQNASEFLLFCDADIWHPEDSLRKLIARAIDQELDLVSRMVTLNCVSVAERLLIPAFVFFFAMLYPFRRANDPASSIAAAAGGTMLVRRSALDRAGGLAAIRGALIDDCALARLIKDSGDTLSHRCELTLSREIRSLRSYPALADIWRMVARTAFTQLKYSVWLLAGTVVGMGLLFVVPLLALVSGDLREQEIGVVAWLLISALYLPTVLLYRLPALWSLTLPIAALVYIGATIDSARLTWQGKGGLWKGRTEARRP